MANHCACDAFGVTDSEYVRWVRNQYPYPPEHVCGTEEIPDDE